MNNQIVYQSNVISNNDKESGYAKILYRVADDIIKIVSPAYGPGAVDQFIMKDGDNFIFTKDGFEILSSISFDNAAFNGVKQVILDAARIQGEKKGDSSTTLILFTAIAIKHTLGLHDNIRSSSYSKRSFDSYVKRSFDEIEARLVARLNEIKVDQLDTSDIEVLTDLVFSITRDHEITNMCVQPFYRADSLPFISFEKDSLSNKMEIENLKEPKIEARVAFAPIISYFTKFDLTQTRVIILDNMFDVAEDDILDLFMASMEQPVIVIAKGLSPDGQNALKRYDRRLQKNKLSDDAEILLEIASGTRKGRVLQPLIVVTIAEVLKYHEDFFRGLFTLVHGRDNYKATRGLQFDTIMKELLLQSPTYDHYCRLLNKSKDNLISSLDFSSQMKEMLEDFSQHLLYVSFEDGHLHFKFHEMTNEGEQFKQMLEKQMQNNSPSASANAKIIYKALFGSYIKIKIGSDLVLDRSNKYELVKDAILSTKNAMEFGIHYGSIVETVFNNIENRFEDSQSNTFNNSMGDLFLSEIFAELIKVKGGIDIQNPLRVIDPQDSVKSALINGMKTARKLVESSMIAVNNLYNINYSKNILEIQEVIDRETT